MKPVREVTPQQITNFGDDTSIPQGFFFYLFPFHGLIVYRAYFSDENCAPLGYYAENSDNFLTTIPDNLLVPCSTAKNVKESPDAWRMLLRRTWINTFAVIPVVIEWNG